MDPLAELAARWREEAETLRSYGADRLAEACERHAEEVEVALRAWRTEELTLREAAEETGFSRKHLRRLVREDKIPDSRPPGSNGTIRVRRCDLPRKAAADRESVAAVDSMAAKLQDART